MPLSIDLVGTWQVIDRIDRDAHDRVVDEPNLGPDPVALLFYDRAGYFGAQFMRRRAPDDHTGTGLALPTQQANNPRAGAGYDAYFGTYVVDDATGRVTQTLLGALARENVGMGITRQMEVRDGVLTILVPTTTADGRAVVRTLRCQRADG